MLQNIGCFRLNVSHAKFTAIVPPTAPLQFTLMPIEEQTARPGSVTVSTFSKLTLLLRLLVPFLLLLAFAGDLLRTFFSGDDFMNLYKYVETGWSACRGIFLFWSSDYYRPNGAFLYLAFYHFFGLHPIPFKILVLALLLLNLAVALFLFRTLFHSPALAALAGILIAYHAAETQLYYSFGTIYDITCFTFMYAALVLFIRVREQGEFPGGWALLTLVLLQIAALNSKEMAVALPLLVMLYEVIASPDARKRDFDPHGWLAPFLMGIIVLIYVAGKIGGASALSQSAFYQPQISAHKYIDSMSRYLDEILYRTHFFHGKLTVLFLCAGLAVALVLRSRLMLLGWLWFLVAFLPLNFIPDRSGFVLYIPIVGLAVAFAAFCRDLYARLPIAVRGSRIAVHLGPESLVFFLIVSILVVRLDRREKVVADPVEKTPLFLNQQFAADLQSETPKPAPHAHLLFLNDPFPPESWSAVFLPSLVRHDMTLAAARAHQNFGVLAAPLLSRYDEIYDYNEPHLKRIQASELPARLAALRAAQGFVELGDGVWIDPSAYMWTKRIFTLQAGCATSESVCHITADFSVPREAYPDTPVHHVIVKLDGVQFQSAELDTAKDRNPVATPLNAGATHTLTYEMDATVPQSQHPADPRELGLVLRGAVIAP
jgi:hypothetical protein